MMHSDVFLNGSAWSNVIEFNVVGQNGQQPKLSLVEDKIWEITFTPSEFYGFGEEDYVSGINTVFNNGSWDKMGQSFDPYNQGGCIDFFIKLQPFAVIIDPPNATVFDEITLTLDARISCPVGSLLVADSVKMHAGVTINGNIWQNAIHFDASGFNGQSTKLEANGDSTWSITFVPFEYFGTDPEEVVSAINIVFNGGDWNLGEGKDFNPQFPDECMDFKIPLHLPVSIDSNPNTPLIQMFPNPASSQIHFSNLHPANEIKIYNSLGQVVHNLENLKSPTLTISITDLNKGLYIVYIKTNNGFETRKLIKN